MNLKQSRRIPATRSRFWLVEQLEERTLFSLPTIPTATQNLNSAMGPDTADPVRNVAYVVDQGTHRILAINTGSGTTVGVATPVADVGGLAVSIDDNRLFASEPGAFQIEVFSLPSMALLKTIKTSFAATQILPAANNRLIGITDSVIGINADTGAQLYSMPLVYNGLLKTNRDGTRLYSRVRGLSGNDGGIGVYDISGTGSPVTLTSIPGPTGANSTDFAVDATAGLAYFEDAAAPGLEVTQLSSGAMTTWTYPASGALNSVATLPGGPYVITSNFYGTVAQFNLFGVAVGLAQLANGANGQTLVMTPNGNCVSTFGTGINIIGLSSMNVTENVASITTVPPAAQNAIINQSQSFSLGSFTQLGATGPFTATVSWGDGSADTTFPVSAPGAIPAASHTYATPGSRTATISLTDSKGYASNASTFGVNVGLPSYADLSVAIDHGTSTPVPGQGLAYTLNYANLGNASLSGVVLTEKLPANTSFDAASSVGWNSADGLTYTYAVGAIAAGAQSAATFAVNVNQSLPAGSKVVNSASIVDDGKYGSDTNPSDNTAADSLTVAGSVSCITTVDAGGSTAVPGSSVSYTVVVSNNGTSNIAGLTVSVPIPAALTSVSWSASDNGNGATGFTVSGSGSVADVVSLPVGAAITYQISGTVQPSAVGTLSLSASAGGLSYVPTSQSSVNLTLTPQVDLAMSITGNDPVLPGTDAVTFTIDIANVGPSNVAGVSFSDLLTSLAGVGYDSIASGATASSPSGTLGGSSPKLLETLSLPAGSNIQFTITGTLVAGTTGILSNTPTITLPAGVTELDPTNNSATFSGTIATAPTVSTQPVARTVIAGNAATFTAAATGTPSPTVQWQVSVAGGAFSDLPGQTDTSLVISAADASLDGNKYRAVFTNAVGTDTTTAALLTVNTGPTVTLQPKPATLLTGATATFTAAATGSPTPTVQWQVSVNNGAFTNISGATGTTLTLTNVGTSLNGNRYQAVFKNAAGIATTTPALLSVSTGAPSVSTQPSSQTVFISQSVTFTTVATGTPTPTVQWQVSVKSGAFTNISGATKAALTLTGVTAAMTGNRYRAVYTNSKGTATSNPATLTVNLAPLVTLQPVTKTVNFGSTTTLTAAAAGSPTPAVQWQVSVNNAAFTNISGATGTTLTLSSVSAAMSGNRYRAVFTNSHGSATTGIATLTVNLAPVISVQPAAKTVAHGATATFTAGATGSPTPTVQWQVSVKGGAFTNIAGATKLTLSLASVTVGMSGNKYRAVFSNSHGSATSNAVALTVT